MACACGQRGPDARRWRFLVAATVWWAAVLAFVPLARPIVEGLRGMGWLETSVRSTFFVLSVALAWAWLGWRRRRGLSWSAALLWLGGCVALAALAQMLPRAEERIHLIQYGVLGMLLWEAWPGRWPARVAGALAVGSLAGWLDEVLQWFVPERVYDLRDFGLNALAVGLGVGLGAWRTWLARAATVATAEAGGEA